MIQPILRSVPLVSTRVNYWFFQLTVLTVTNMWQYDTVNMVKLIIFQFPWSYGWRHYMETLSALTHWDRDKMAAIFMTTFWHGFSWKKVYEFRLNFNWSLVQIMAWCRPGDLNHYLNQWWWLYLCICVTRPHWVNGPLWEDSICQKWISSQRMKTSSNGNILRVTGHLCGKFTGHRWIPRTKASGAELWCFLWSTLQ